MIEMTVDRNTDEGVVTATTPRGQELILVADEEGDYLVVEHVRFLGAESTWQAHRIGPCDRPRPEFTRFALLEAVPPPL